MVTKRKKHRIRAHETPVRFFQRWGERDPVTGCLHFVGKVNSRGHGLVMHDGKEWQAHRLAIWLIKYSHTRWVVPQMWVGQMCGTPDCIEPSHLVEAATKAELYVKLGRASKKGKNGREWIA